MQLINSFTTTSSTTTTRETTVRWCFSATPRTKRVKAQVQLLTEDYVLFRIIKNIYMYIDFYKMIWIHLKIGNTMENEIQSKNQTKLC
jgi:hypothetical protein